MKSNIKLLENDKIVLFNDSFLTRFGSPGYYGVVKYLGDKSLSSLIEKLLSVFWWIMAALMVTGVPLEILALFRIPGEGSPLYAVLTYVEIPFSAARSSAYKVMILLQIAVIVPVTLILIRKLRDLFRNFRLNLVFRSENITLLGQLALLFLLLSAASLNILSLILSIVLLVLTEIFKRGAALQEENDWTV